MENGRDIDEVLDEHEPQLFFLDIHMPGVNGLEAARVIGDRAHVVFVTAFDQYAVEAFERGAIDYVLKPFNEERLALTVRAPEGAPRASARRPSTSWWSSLAGAHRRRKRAPSTFAGSRRRWASNVRLIPVEEVLFFQSDEKYTRVVTCEAEALIRKPIRELLEELDPARFWQIHRATIVNVDYIASVRARPEGPGRDQPCATTPRP